VTELRRLYVKQQLPAWEIAAGLGVGDSTMLGWLADAGIERRHSALKGRRRGERDLLVRPTARTLRRLYVEQDRSLAEVAAQVGATVHLVRNWMDDYGIDVRPSGGVAGRRRTPMPRRHQAPPEDELRRLRVEEHWSLAERYRVHPQTVSRWLCDYDIVTDVRGRRRLPGVSVAELVDRYQHSQLTAAALARQVGLGRDGVVSELRAAGVPAMANTRPASSWPAGANGSAAHSAGTRQKSSNCLPAIARGPLRVRSARRTVRPPASDGPPAALDGG
jgi:hypothetical protein